MCNRVWKQIEKSQFANRGNCRCVPALPPLKFLTRYQYTQYSTCTVHNLYFTTDFPICAQNRYRYTSVHVPSIFL